MAKARRKAAPKKKAARKAAKRVPAKKKPAARKKPAAKKKAVARKTAVAKKKPAARKKTVVAKQRPAPKKQGAKGAAKPVAAKARLARKPSTKPAGPKLGTTLDRPERFTPTERTQMPMPISTESPIRPDDVRSSIPWFERQLPLPGTEE